MKVGSFQPVNGKIENIKVMRPCQALLFHIVYSDNEDFNTTLQTAGCKLQVLRQNSNTGQKDTIVPFIQLGKLAEIATFNEGCIRLGLQSAHVPVMLSPAGNIALDNDKYLEISVVDTNLYPGLQSIDVYAIESEKISPFLTKYNKMSVPAGIARQYFNVKDSDILSLPTTGYDEIQLKTNTGSVITLTKIELQYLQSTKNDLTAYRMDDATNMIVSGMGGAQLHPYGNSFILNLLSIESIEIIRDSNSASSFDFILGDLVQ